MNAESKSLRKLQRAEQKRRRREAYRSLGQIFSEFHFESKFRDARLTLVDVGARGGLATHWEQAVPILHVIAFDPDPDVSTDFSKTDCPVTFVPTALSDTLGYRQFYVYKNLYESSFFRPNLQLRERFGNKDDAEIVKTVRLAVTTLDEVAQKEALKFIDFLKLDTQGCELDILRGAERSLRDVVFGLEVEVEFLPIYEQQPLFGEIDAYVRTFGFELLDLYGQRSRRMLRRGVAGFEKLAMPKGTGQLTGADAVYLRSPSWMARRLESPTQADGHRYFAGALAVCIVYGAIDYGLELLQVCKDYVSQEDRHRFGESLASYYRRWRELGLDHD